MTDPAAPEVDATPTPEPTPTPSTDVADLQAQLDAARQEAADAVAAKEAFGADNAKLRKQRREWKAKQEPGKEQGPVDATGTDDGESESLRRLAISAEAKAELIKQGADSALADLAVSALDMEQIEILDGRIEGVAEAVTSLLKERPELKESKTATPGVVNGAPSGQQTQAPDPLMMSREQLAAMTDAEWDAFADANPIVEFQLGDGPVTRMNISSIPNAAFGRVQAAQERHKQVTRKLTGGS
ncbi:MAG: phage scaffolding protein [Planctomycetota bacterium]|jgi:hypothetical protein